MRRMILAAALALTANAALAAWNDGHVWNDGRAEVASYDSTRMQYGKPRDFRETLLLVKEDLRQDTLVKSDNPKKTKNVTVFKLNDIIRFDTENYPYTFLTSVFMKADEPNRVVKISVGSQEWCGNTWKRFTSPKGADGDLTWSSYFDGEADGSAHLDVQADDLFEDQLPVALRSLQFKEGYEEKIRVWESVTSSHGVAPTVSSATVRVVGEDVIHCHAGAIPSWEVDVMKAGGAIDRYWFEKAEPHIMTKMAAADGGSRLLYGRARWSYWDRRIPAPNVLK